MAGLTRRAALAAVGAGGGALALGYLLREVRWSALGSRLLDHNGMGVDPADMSRYMEMFNRHNEITRTVEEIPDGVRTTTQSNSPDLTAQLQAHVSSMYAHLDRNAEVMCMSGSLPALFRNANGYRRQLTFTPNGVIAEETTSHSGARPRSHRLRPRRNAADDAGDDGPGNDGARNDGPPLSRRIGRAETQVLDVVNRLVEQLSDVVVVKAVDNVAAVAVTGNQSERPQEPQLVRHRRLFHPDRRGQLADRARRLPEPGQDHQPIG
jgi:hypothetical protein